LYQADAIDNPAAGGNQFFQRLPAFIQESEGRTRWEQRFATDQAFQANVKDYYRLITGIDAVVGDLVNQLKRLNLYEDTAIVFTSDNGFFLGEHGLAGKWLMYDESIRIPMIIKPARRDLSLVEFNIDRMALNIDLAPTILDIAGVAIPSTMQGKSLLPLMRDQFVEWREDWFYEYRFDFGNRIPTCEGVRTETLKYVEYTSAEHVEMYDLVNDPLETTNLAADPAYEPVLDDMSARLVRVSESAS
jgi:arylsulfatase A-like enzyme